MNMKCPSFQIQCMSLHDVINYLVDHTEGVLIPLIIEEPYEKNICTCKTFLVLFADSTWRFLLLSFFFLVRSDLLHILVTQAS